MKPLKTFMTRARTISNRSFALLACSSLITTGAVVGGSLTREGAFDNRALAAALSAQSPADETPAEDLQASADPTDDGGSPAPGPSQDDAPVDPAPSAPPPTDTAPTDDTSTDDSGDDTTDDGDDGSTDTPAGPTGPIGHVFVVTMASPGYDQSFGKSSEMPYLSKKLQPRGALLQNYSLLSDNALPNNIGLVGGQKPNALTEDDCSNYKEFPTSASPDSKGYVAGDGCVYPVLALSIADQVGAVGGSWHAYIGGMTDDKGKDANCVRPDAATPDATQGQDPPADYQTPHNPFVYFHSLLDLGSCSSNDVPLDTLSKDLKKVDSTADYTFISPGTCDAGAVETCADGKSGVESSDDFLADVVPQILASAAFKDDGLLLVVPTEKSPVYAGSDSTVGALAVTNFGTPGAVISDDLDPYSVLHTTEDIFGVSALAAASTSTSFADDLVSSGD